jgi:hypothetical protein
LLNKQNNNDPAFHAIVLLVVIQGFNVYAIMDIINYVYDINIYSHIPVLFGLLFFAVLLTPNFIFIFRKHNEIVNLYKNETREQKVWGFVGLFLYILGSIAVLIILEETIGIAA